jgi:uncharacterized glyoxalase superfamily protein PhnB
VELEVAYPVVVTDRLGECRDFYVRRLGFHVLFEASWFVYVASSDESGHGIAFMAPDHPSTPPGPEAVGGDGLLLTLQVANAASAYDRVRRDGLEVDHPLRDEPWGQRRFGVRDPAGVWVDVVEQIEPEPGYWDRYAP